MTGSVGLPRPVIRSGGGKQIGIAGSSLTENDLNTSANQMTCGKDTMCPVTSRLYPLVGP